MRLTSLAPNVVHLLEMPLDQLGAALKPEATPVMDASTRATTIEADRPAVLSDRDRATLEHALRTDTPGLSDTLVASLAFRVLSRETAQRVLDLGGSKQFDLSADDADSLDALLRLCALGDGSYMAGLLRQIHDHNERTLRLATLARDSIPP